jgi:hypothetical protein
MKWRIAVASATTLFGAACLMSIDESKIGAPSCRCSGEEVCHDGKCVMAGSCKELLAQHAGAKTGQHDLTIGGAVATMYCDMDTDGGLTLVFRVSAGIEGNPYELLDRAVVSDDKDEAKPTATSKHYVSRALQSWGSTNFPIERVLVRLLGDDGSSVRDLWFNGKGTTRTGFFAPQNFDLTKSPWDTGPLADAYYFSASGHPERYRNFFIHKKYSTCETDEGWLVIHGTNTGQTDCAYENPAGLIRMYYAPGAGPQRWLDRVPEAKAFTIFVR